MILLIILTVIFGVVTIAYFMLAKQKIYENAPQIQRTISSLIPTSNTLKTEINSWKNYKIDKYNFSIKYPPGWIYKDGSNASQNENIGIATFYDNSINQDQKDNFLNMVIVYVTTPNSLRGEEFTKLTESQFYDPNNNFWLKGEVGGGGPGYTYSQPIQRMIAGKKAIEQTSHPTTVYEKSKPSQLSKNYWIWLGNNNIMEIEVNYDEFNPNKSDLLKLFEEMITTIDFKDK